MNAFLSQWRTELRLMLRQGEQMLVSVGIPIGVLVFFSLVKVLPTKSGTEPADFLTPATMALAIMSTAMVSIGIGTAFERDYGALKRLGATPLGRGRWLAAKLATVFTVELAQMAALAAIGYALGWRPGSAWPLAVLAALLGTAAFAGLGLLLAGTLKATTNLAATNALYLLMMLLGGMIIPIDKLPIKLQHLAELTPGASLAGLMIDALGPKRLSSTGWLWLVLAVWAVAMPALAAWRFRWEPTD